MKIGKVTLESKWQFLLQIINSAFIGMLQRKSTYRLIPEETQHVYMRKHICVTVFAIVIFIRVKT